MINARGMLLALGLAGAAVGHGQAISPAYQFKSGQTTNYRMNATFDGFLPILGGNEGKAEVGMTIRVAGNDPLESRQRASHEITAFEIKFNGARLPLTLDNVVDFFPLTRLELSPLGEVLKNDAPDRDLPVKLPGLDAKRFADITYLPLQFSDKPVIVGDKWSFKKSFGGSDVNYEVTVQGVTANIARLSVKVTQDFTVLENDLLEVTTKREEAVQEARTVLTGAGTVEFDLAAGQTRKVEMVNDAVTTIKPLDGSASTERKLKTTLTVTRIEASTTGNAARPAPRAAAAPAPARGFDFGQMWDRGARTVQRWVDTGRETLAAARVILALSLRMVPGMEPLVRQLGL